MGPPGRPARRASPPLPHGTPSGAAPTTLRRLLLAEAEDRRTHPREDFLSEVVHARIDGEPITPHSLSSFLFGAIVAGHETTLAAAANLAYQLGADPELQRRLAEHPELAGPAVDECLRHRSPVQSFFRTVTRDVEVAGTELRAGDKVMLLYGAANRDPGVFADPDRFDLDRYESERDARRHLAYGFGVHRCAGAHLADVELRLLLARAVPLRADAAGRTDLRAHGPRRLPGHRVAPRHPAAPPRLSVCRLSALTAGSDEQHPVVRGQPATTSTGRASPPR